jgi:hypothetical protein
LEGEKMIGVHTSPDSTSAAGAATRINKTNKVIFRKRAQEGTGNFLVKKKCEH